MGILHRISTNLSGALRTFFAGLRRWCGSGVGPESFSRHFHGHMVALIYKDLLFFCLAVQHSFLLEAKTFGTDFDTLFPTLGDFSLFRSVGSGRWSSKDPKHDYPSHL